MGFQNGDLDLVRFLHLVYSAKEGREISGLLPMVSMTLRLRKDLFGEGLLYSYSLRDFVTPVCVNT